METTSNVNALVLSHSTSDIVTVTDSREPTMPQLLSNYFVGPVCGTSLTQL